MKKLFEEPAVEVVGFSVEDVLAASSDYTPDDDEGGGAPL